MEAPPPLPAPPAAPGQPRMSLFARLLNVFAIPGAVFDDVSLSRHSVTSWLVPLLMSAAAVSTALWLSLCQPAVLQEFQKQQEENLSKLQSERKITAAQADANRKLIGWLTQQPVARSVSIVGAASFSAIRLCFWAFVLWLLGRAVFKVRLGYGKALEVSGLASMIAVLGTVVAIVLSIGFGPVPDASAMARVESSTQTTFFIIVANAFNIWFVALLASGLARLVGGRFGQTFLPVMGIWLVLQMILGFGTMAVGAAR